MSRKIRSIISSALAFCLMLTMTCISPVKASAATEIKKVICQTSYMPVVLMDVSYITTSITTKNCQITSYGWYDSNGKLDTDQFDNCTYRFDMRIDAADGYIFSTDVTGYINNEPCTITRADDGSYIVLTRNIDPMVWAPTVIKNPGNETVDEGGWASFVSTAMYSSGTYWTLVSPDGKRTVKVSEIENKFPGMTASGDGTEKLILRNISADLNGWGVMCSFKGPGGDANSKKAVLTVNSTKPAAETAAAAEEKPVEEAVKEPEPSAEPTPSAESETAAHEHNYSGEWQYNSSFHWQKCECGSTSSKKVHDLEWKTTKQATEAAEGEQTGTCTVCGYQVTEAVRQLTPVRAQSAQPQQTAQTQTGSETEKAPQTTLQPEEQTKQKFGFDYMNLVFAAMLLVALIVLGIELAVAMKAGKHKKKRKKKHR